jgi:hypothetical protein
MGLTEILWTVAGVVVPTLLGTAWAMVGLTPPEFWIARGAIIIAAIILLGVIMVWLVLLGWPPLARIFAAIVFGAGSLVGFSEMLRWVNARENLIIAQADAIADKRVSIRTKLQEFYIQGGNLLNVNISKDTPQQAFEKYIADVNNWANSTSQWIKENLGDAAQARFLDTADISIINWGRAATPAHNNAINYLTVWRKNLSQLIESSAWDQIPPKDSKKGP